MGRTGLDTGDSYILDTEIISSSFSVLSPWLNVGCFANCLSLFTSSTSFSALMLTGLPSEASGVSSKDSNLGPAD